MSEKERVLVIGLDGATFNLILPWVREGKLPSFSHMMKTGVYGELRSTVPVLTSPAWSSFMTGKNPGKHGITGFISRKNDSYGMRVVNSTHRSAREIWTILSESDRKVGVVNVPLTYPPKRVKGFMITGMMTPPQSDNFTYPPLLKEELKRIVGEDTIDPFFTYLEEDGVFVNEVFNSTEKLTKISLFLLKKHKPDLFVVVFNGTDYIQHKLWRYLDPNHPGYEAEKSGKYLKTVLRYYQKIDEIIDSFLKTTDENATVMVMSDHGAGPLHKYVHVNLWLMQRGLLKLKKRWITRLKRFLYRIGVNPEKLYNLFFKTRLGGIRIRINRGNEKFRRLLNRLFISFSDVDWSNTQAYSLGSGLIFINLKGREPLGAVNPGREYEALREGIIRRLYEFRDPETGKNVVEKVYKKEEIYAGPYMGELPDLILLPNLGYMTFEEYEIAANSVLTQAEAVSATHRLNGILLMKGPGIKRGVRLQGAHITDLAPTILHALGLPIPTDMDGKVLIEALTPRHLRANPIRYVQEPGRRPQPSLKRKEPYGNKEEKIKLRLRRLGYLPRL